MYYIKIQCATGKKSHAQKIHEGQVLNYLSNLNLLTPACVGIHSQSRRESESIQVDLDLNYNPSVHGFVVPGSVINKVERAIRVQGDQGHIRRT